MYHLRIKRDERAEYFETELKAHTFVNNPKRYVELFAKPVSELIEEQESAPIDPSEIPDIDTWLSTVDKERVGRPISRDDDEGWL